MEVLEKVLDTRITISGNYDIKRIYEKVFPVVAKFIYSAGGSLEDARDVFHDALIIFMEKNSQQQVHTILSEEAYIVGISKHLWIRKNKKENNKILIDDLEKEISIPEDYFPTVNERRLLNFLKVAGKKCMDLLRAFYYQKAPIKKIVDELGYSNEHSASVQKYKCLEKVRNTVKEKSLTYDDFTE